MKTATVISWVVRLFLLSSAIFLAVIGPGPVWLARLIPSFSPLAVVAASIAGRTWVPGLVWCVAPFAILILALLKGRFFCRHICPAGTLYTLAAKTGIRKSLFPWRINGILFWSILLGAIAGVPFFLPMDPLATFNAAFTPATISQGIAVWVGGGILPLFMILGAFQPMIWCSRFCPLGYAMDLLGRFRRAMPAANADPIRRDILIAAGIGLPLSVIAKHFSHPGKKPTSIPVLPPGAESMDRLSNTCTRCYLCVQKCPSKVIRLLPPKLESLGTAFLPHLDMSQGACAEYCNDCTKACPTGALKPLTIDEKRVHQLGLAVIERSICLAWTDGEHCLVCQEFCPYQAVGNDPRPGDNLPRPVMKPELCRGCGVCENQCPAIRAGKAIRIHGLLTQRKMKHIDLPPSNWEG